MRYVRLGDLDYTTHEDRSQYQDFHVSKAIRHPEFKPPSSYNDIGLLKLDRRAVLSDFVKPACLHIQNDIELPQAVLLVAGWGKTEHLAVKGSSRLRKAGVMPFSQETCSRIYGKDPRQLKAGIVEELQICAGSYFDVNNTCRVGAPIADPKHTDLGIWVLYVLGRFWRTSAARYIATKRHPTYDRRNHFVWVCVWF